MDMPLALLNRRRRGSVLNPAILFSVAGSRGFFYDFSDYTTQFTDTAGTTPVTSTGQSLALVLDESQGLALGPELIVNGDLSGGVTGWTQILGTRSVVGGRLRTQKSSGLDGRASSVAMTCVVGRTYQVSLEAYKGTVASCNGYISISATSSAGNIFAFSRAVDGPFSFVFVATQTTHWLHLQCTLGVDGDYSEWDNISVRELPGNHATQATAGSRALTTTIGTGFRGIAFDGVDDFLQTAAIDFSNSDKMTVVAGVRKLSDAAQGIVVELTASAGTIPNSFNTQAPGPSTSYRIVSGGSLTAGAVFDATGLAAPRTDVLTGLANISGATASLRANGVQVAGGSAAQGTGNFANDIIYIGRRGGTSLPFNGILTFLCVINRTLTAAELAQLETFANSRTGAF